MTTPSFTVSVTIMGKESTYENLAPTAFITFIDNLKLKNRHKHAKATDQDGNLLYENGQWTI